MTTDYQKAPDAELWRVVVDYLCSVYCSECDTDWMDKQESLTAAFQASLNACFMVWVKTQPPSKHTELPASSGGKA